MGIFHNIRAD
jgi:hypothetical protein